jgi:hypothetical protein
VINREFISECGVSKTTIYNWNRNFSPIQASGEAILNFFLGYRAYSQRLYYF